MSKHLALTEAQLQQRVLDLAKHCHWMVVHIRATEVSKGRWSVPYTGDLGLPDLILCKNGRVILAELKSASGKTTPQQDAWLTAAGDHARLWRPSDWNTILAELAS
jgi:hypothetical protein